MSTHVTDVLIVDDHPMLRDGLCSWLSSQDGLNVCGQAAGIAEAVAVAQASKPDVGIIDVVLGDENGIGLIAVLREAHPAIRILVFSMHDETLYAERALRAGAHGYVNKSSPPDVLSAAIRRILDGKLYVSECVQEMILTRTSNTASSSGPAASISSITDREFQALELIADGLSQREIAERMGISVKTVNTYRGTLTTRFQLNNASELTRMAIEWKLTGKLKDGTSPTQSQ